MPSVALFLHRIIQFSGMFQAVAFSVALSARDATSVRSLSPRSWLSSVQVADVVWQGKSCCEFGCRLWDAKYQRYGPREGLTGLLNRYDLLQVVGGSPAGGMSSKHIRPPFALLGG